MPDAPDELRTLEAPRSVDAGPRPVWPRRVGTVGLLVVVLAGALNLFGLRTTTTTRSADGWTVAVHHATVARAGLDVPWHVTITKDGGLPDEVQVRVTADYFEIFETQGLTPEPSTEATDDEWVYWTFDTPTASSADASTMTVDFDTYVQPSSHVGRSGEVSVLVGGEPVVTVPFRTVLLP